MSSIAKLCGADFDQMVAKGAFDSLPPMKIELINGELRFMNPAGPLHEAEIEFLTDWSYANTDRNLLSIRVQSSISCSEHRPEPDVIWIRKMPTRMIRPTSQDVLLLIEVADSSLLGDLVEKAELYATHAIQDYWVVDVSAQQVHIHRNPRQGSYDSVAVHSKPAVIAPLCYPTASLSLNELFDL